MGLARAFLAGGAGAVLASQWPVGPGTAELMGAFYRGLASGEEPGAAGGRTGELGGGGVDGGVALVRVDQHDPGREDGRGRAGSSANNPHSPSPPPIAE